MTKDNKLEDKINYILEAIAKLNMTISVLSTYVQDTRKFNNQLDRMREIDMVEFTNGDSEYQKRILRKIIIGTDGVTND